MTELLLEAQTYKNRMSDKHAPWGGMSMIIGESKGDKHVNSLFQLFQFWVPNPKQSKTWKRMMIRQQLVVFLVFF